MSHDWAPHAASYDRDISALEPELRRVTDALLDAVRAGPGVRLLDLACGPGHTTAAAHARGAAALGIDVTPAMVQAAKDRFPDVRSEVGNMLDPPAGPWDAITCRLGAHHVADAWIHAAARVLLPGGRIAIAELAPADAPARANGMREAGRWVELLEQAGFENVTVTSLRVQLPQGDTVNVIAGSKPT